MKKDLWHLNIETLQTLYQEEERQLEEKLLAGATWEEVQEERKRIGELSTIIYKKINSKHFGNPAEHTTRTSED